MGCQCSSDKNKLKKITKSTESTQKNAILINNPSFLLESNSKFSTNSKNPGDQEESKAAEFFSKYHKFNSFSSTDSFQLNNLSEINNNKFAKGQFLCKGQKGDIYHGLALETGEIVTLKVLKFDFNSPSALFAKKDKIVAIAKRISLLNHPNIVKFLGAQNNINEKEVEIITEFCNGGSIKQLLKKFGEFSENLIKLYIRQILEGLVFLHDLGIVHKSIKSSNILVDKNGIIKINDFLIQDVFVEDPYPEDNLKFQTNDFKEYPYWISPEFASNSNSFDKSTDIWSLGYLIIEMASKEYPWQNDCKSPKELISFISDLSNLNISPRIPSHLSKELKDFITNCFILDPNQRPTARKLMDHSIFKSSNSIELQIKESNNFDRFVRNESIKSKRIENKLSKEKDDNKFIRNERVSSEPDDKIYNFLAENSEKAGCFSISMSIYSKESHPSQNYVDEKKSKESERNLNIFKKINVIEEAKECNENSPTLNTFGETKTKKKKYFEFPGHKVV